LYPSPCASPIPAASIHPDLFSGNRLDHTGAVEGAGPPRNTLASVSKSKLANDRDDVTTSAYPSPSMSPTASSSWPMCEQSVSLTPQLGVDGSPVADPQKPARLTSGGNVPHQSRPTMMSLNPSPLKSPTPAPADGITMSGSENVQIGSGVRPVAVPA
jgi:hypothetical protein